MRRTWWLDLLCVAALIWAGVLHWPTGDVSLSVAGPEAPAWGTMRDALLDGPDAGEWARSMLAFHDGRYDELATHRLPGWIVVVNALMMIEDNVVRAGHLANHLLNVSIGLCIFGLCRLWGQRWIGLGAGALAMLSGHALSVSLRFGVDATVLAMVPLTILGAVVAVRYWKLSILSGVMAAFATATHFSTLPYVLPALVFILLAGGRHRWLAALGHLIGFGATLYLLSMVFPVSTWEGFQVSIANGIAPGYQGNGRVSNWDTALEIMRSGMGTAVERSVAQLMVQIRPSWLPWSVSLILPWLGVLGIGLKQQRPSKPDADWWDRTDLAMGLGLLFCLAPLPVFAAAQAPLRYGDNLSPLGAVLLVRGLASAVWIVLATVRLTRFRMLPTAVNAGLALIIFAGAVEDAKPARRPLYPTLEEVGYWQLGQALKEHFSPGDGVASPVREALVEGRLSYCPQRICPEYATEDAYMECLSVHAMECDGDGPVGYVVTTADLYDPNAVARRDMDKWVASKWSPVAEVENPKFQAWIYQIPRDEIPELAQPSGPNAAHDGSGLVGPPGGGPAGPAGPPLGADGLPLPGPVEPPTDGGPMGPPNGGPVGPPNGGPVGPPNR